MAVWEKVWDVTTIRYSGTCNHPFIMIIIMIMSLAGVAVSRAALRPCRSASMPTSEGGELLVCLASIAFSNTEGEKREGGRDSDTEIHNNSFDIDLAECGYTLEPRTSPPSLATYLHPAQCADYCRTTARVSYRVLLMAAWGTSQISH